MLDILRTEDQHTVIILNKIDKLNQREVAAASAAIKAEVPEVEVAPYSAIEKKGSAQVLNKITL